MMHEVGYNSSKNIDDVILYISQDTIVEKLTPNTDAKSVDVNAEDFQLKPFM